MMLEANANCSQLCMFFISNKDVIKEETVPYYLEIDFVLN